MLGGWKQTIGRSIPNRTPRIILDGDHQGVQYGKIILIDDITKKREDIQVKRKNVCQAFCKNGKQCVHTTRGIENFCKRHLKVETHI